MAGAARSRRRGHGPPRRAKRTLDATGATQAYRQGGGTRAKPAGPAPAASPARSDAGSPETEAVSGQARRARRAQRECRGAQPLCWLIFSGPFDRFRNTEHNVNMIHSFTCLDTEALFRSQVVPRFKNIERVARRKLLQLHAATELASLRVPPGNQLEALKGDRRGQHSIRINDQWRICFVWHDDGAHQVEIVDYH